MVRKAAFLYKIDTDERPQELMEKMLTFAKARKINYDTKHPWRGFRVNGDSGQVIASIADGLFFASYGYEMVRKVTYFNDSKVIMYIPQSVSIIADPERNILSIYGTSNKSLAEQIFEALQHDVEDENYIRLSPITFSDNFLKWLVDNATTQSKNMFIRMNGVKVVKLRDYDSSLNDAILLGDEEIGESALYQQIQNEGLHKYVVGFIKIAKWVYRLRIYDYGQITITTSDISSVSPIISVIAKELLRLQRIHSKQ